MVPSWLITAHNVVEPEVRFPQSTTPLPDSAWYTMLVLKVRTASVVDELSVTVPNETHVVVLVPLQAYPNISSAATVLVPIFACPVVAICNSASTSAGHRQRCAVKVLSSASDPISVHDEPLLPPVPLRLKTKSLPVNVGSARAGTGRDTRIASTTNPKHQLVAVGQRALIPSEIRPRFSMATSWVYSVAAILSQTLASIAPLWCCGFRLCKRSNHRPPSSQQLSIFVRKHRSMPSLP